MSSLNNKPPTKSELQEELRRSSDRLTRANKVMLDILHRQSTYISPLSDMGSVPPHVLYDIEQATYQVDHVLKQLFERRFEREK